MRFEFATAHRILFGPGTLKEIGPLARHLGGRAFVVTGRTTARAGRLLALLAESQVSAVVFPLAGEPTVAAVGAGAALARSECCDLVIGYGGGSAVDAAKAIAALVTNGGEPLDYLEVIGRGQPLGRPSAPCVAIPTTAGTGAEVTRNAVLAAPEHGVKASLRSPFLLPQLALVDPELTHDVPPDITAATGLDTLTQLIEPYVSNRANPMTDGFCLAGLQRVARSLRRAWEDGRDAEARADMALASLCGGLALANAGLGAVHGLAAPIGGSFLAPHGAVCAALLPAVMEVNLRALRKRLAASGALHRYQRVAELITGRESALPEEGVAWVRRLCGDLRIPGLGAHGVEAAAVPTLVAKATHASSMKANPVPLTPAELEEILVRSL